MSPGDTPMGQSEAEELRKRLKPAFAGFVTDGNISDRDVLATILDLIVKGNIGIDADTQKEPIELRKLNYVSRDNVLLFENDFINELFSDSKEMAAEQVREKIRSNKLHVIIANGMNQVLEGAKLKRSFLVWKQNGRDVASKLDSSLIISYAEPLAAAKYFIGFVIFVFFIIFLIDFTPMFSVFPTGGFSLFFLASSLIMMVFFVIFVVRMLRRHKRISTKSFPGAYMVLDYAGEPPTRFRAKYAELFGFIKTFPLSQQRLYNEFMPYAVAFGLDSRWNETFGIQKEAPLHSIPFSEASPEVRQEIERVEALAKSGPPQSYGRIPGSAFRTR